MWVWFCGVCVGAGGQASGHDGRVPSLQGGSHPDPAGAEGTPSGAARR